jgi:hypothetical protein
MPARYLLCRPRGGLNDTLCRIALCWQYAARFNRILVIDCRRSCLFGEFSDFFEIIDRSAPVAAVLDDALLRQLNALPCRPAALFGRLESYIAEREPGQRHRDCETRTPTQFAAHPATFAEDFAEPLLVYEDEGGGTASFSLLPGIRLAPAIREEVRAVLATLGQPYHAVHVRNTDYRTDYKTLFARIRGRVQAAPLLVCSDDPAVVSYARRFFAGPVLETPQQMQSMSPTGARHVAGAQATIGAQRRMAIESLIDLACLANAQTLYFGPAHSVLDGPLLRQTGRMVFRPLQPGWLSGFSTLAEHLCTNKDILDAFLGDTSSRRMPDPHAAIRVNQPGVGRQLLWRLRRRVRRLMGPAAAGPAGT